MSTALLGNMMARRYWGAGELLTYVELNEQEAAGLQGFLHLLGRMCLDNDTAEPASGFVGDDCIAAKGGGDLDFTVEAGLGFQYVSASSGPWEVGYQPILVEAQQTGSVTPHDLTKPRIDRLVISASTDDDTAENRSVKDTSSGNVSTQSLNTRRVYRSTVLIVAGTPDVSPTPPAIPSGYIELAQVNVPATSGPITVVDTRARLSLGQDWAPDPAAGFAVSHIVEGHGGSLAVSAGAGMTVEVEAGEMWCLGRRSRHQGAVLSVATADPTNGRYDVVVCHRLTGPRVVTGIAAANPAASVFGVDLVNEVILAKVLIPATTSSISSGNVSDERDLEPHSGQLLQARRLAASRMTNPPLKVLLTAGAQSGDDIPITIALRDTDGATLSLPVARNLTASITTRLLARVFTSTWERALSSGPYGVNLAVGGGTVVGASGNSGILFDTASDGTATLTLTRSSGAFTGLVYVIVEPMVLNSSDRVGHKGYTGATFA